MHCYIALDPGFRWGPVNRIISRLILSWIKLHILFLSALRMLNRGGMFAPSVSDQIAEFSGLKYAGFRRIYS